MTTLGTITNNRIIFNKLQTRQQEQKTNKSADLESASDTNYFNIQEENVQENVMRKNYNIPITSHSSIRTKTAEKKADAKKLEKTDINNGISSEELEKLTFTEEEKRQLNDLKDIDPKEAEKFFADDKLSINDIAKQALEQLAALSEKNEISLQDVANILSKITEENKIVNPAKIFIIIKEIKHNLSQQYDNNTNPQLKTIIKYLNYFLKMLQQKHGYSMANTFNIMTNTEISENIKSKLISSDVLQNPSSTDNLVQTVEMISPELVTSGKLVSSFIAINVRILQLSTKEKLTPEEKTEFTQLIKVYNKFIILNSVINYLKNFYDTVGEQYLINQTPVASNNNNASVISVSG